MARSLDVEYKMRMSSELKEKITTSAKEHNRSINAEIIKRLEESFLTPEDVFNEFSSDEILHYWFNRFGVKNISLTIESAKSYEERMKKK